MKKTNKMMKAALSVAILAGALFFSACQKDKNAPAPNGATEQPTIAGMSINPLVYPAMSHALGKSLADWGVAFFEWQFQYDTDHSPYLDADGTFQNQGQSGDVYFLGGARYGLVVDRNVTIPAGKSLFVPIIYYFENTGCGETADQVLPGVTGTVPFMDQLSLTIDGQNVDLTAYQSITRMFSYAGDASWNSRFCIDGTVQQFVLGGYWAMVKPLTAGSHTIHTTGGASKLLPVIKDVTWHITQQ